MGSIKSCNSDEREDEIMLTVQHFNNQYYIKTGQYSTIESIKIAICEKYLEDINFEKIIICIEDKNKQNNRQFKKINQKMKFTQLTWKERESLHLVRKEIFYQNDISINININHQQESFMIFIQPDFTIGDIMQTLFYQNHLDRAHIDLYGLCTAIKLENCGQEDNLKFISQEKIYCQLDNKIKDSLQLEASELKKEINKNN